MNITDAVIQPHHVADVVRATEADIVCELHDVMLGPSDGDSRGAEICSSGGDAWAGGISDQARLGEESVPVCDCNPFGGSSGSIVGRVLVGGVTQDPSGCQQPLRGNAQRVGPEARCRTSFQSGVGCPTFRQVCLSVCLSVAVGCCSLSLPLCVSSSCSSVCCFSPAPFGPGRCSPLPSGLDPPGLHS